MGKTVVNAISQAYKEINIDLVNDMIYLIQNDPTKYSNEYAKVIVAGLKLAVNKK